MKKLYEEKSISNSVKDVDTASRRIKVAVSQVDTKDLDNDVIDSAAYKRTIDLRGPNGSNMIWHLTDHRASLKDAVGKPKEIYMENGYLVFLTEVPNTSWGNDVLEFYKSGAINQHSVGFRTLKSEPQNAGTTEEYNLIKEIMLYEGSAVLWGAQPNTPTLTVGKSLSREEATSEYRQTLEELGTMTKMFKSGHLTDQSYELIELKINQLTEKLQQLFEIATQPVVKTPDPDNTDELLDVFKTFNNNLKLVV